MRIQNSIPYAHFAYVQLLKATSSQTLDAQDVFLFNLHFDHVLIAFSELVSNDNGRCI